MDAMPLSVPPQVEKDQVSSLIQLSFLSSHYRHWKAEFYVRKNPYTTDPDHRSDAVSAVGRRRKLVNKLNREDCNGPIPSMVIPRPCSHDE
jgi:hypothetical protein